MPTRDKTISSYNPYAFFNVLRIIAIFSVFCTHYLAFFEAGPIFDSSGFLYFFRNAIPSVSIFFAISGLLFALVYQKKIESGELKTGKFFAKRYLRFFLLVFLSNLLMFLYNLISLKAFNQSIPYGTTDIKDLLISAFLGGYGIFTGFEDKAQFVLNDVVWYIQILFYCYLIAIILIRIKKYCKSNLIFLIPVIVSFVILLYQTNICLPFFNDWVAHGLLFFFLGFYLLELLNLMKKSGNITKILLRALSVICIGVCIYLEYHLNRNMHSKGSLSIILALFLMVPQLFVLCYDVKFLNKFSNTKPMKFLSAVSLDFYIWHRPTFAILLMIYWGCNFTSYNTAGWLIPISLVIVFGFAVISNYLNDKKLYPFLLKCFKLN